MQDGYPNRIISHVLQISLFCPNQSPAFINLSLGFFNILYEEVEKNRYKLLNYLQVIYITGIPNEKFVFTHGNTLYIYRTIKKLSVVSRHETKEELGRQAPLVQQTYQ